MKKLVTVLFLQGLLMFGFFGDVNAQRIVDNDLKALILSKCPTCLDNNGNLLSPATTITSLPMLAIANFSIKTSKGLEGFTNLRTLAIEDINFSDSLSVFDSLPPKLNNLKLRMQVEKIRKLPNNLAILEIDFYKDSVMVEFPNSLIEIQLLAINISKLPKLPESLNALYLSVCDEIKSLPALPNKLETLWISGSDVSKLTNLPILPLSLKKLHATGHKNLRYIPNFPNNLTSIELYFCDSLEQIPQPLPSGLNYLDLDFTNVKCLPFLPNSLFGVKASAANCVTNKPTSLTSLSIGRRYNISNVPICSKNNSSCPYPANIGGKIYLDMNNNGAQDNNEPNAKQVVVKTTDGGITVLSDTLGKYNFVGDTLKIYTFSPFFPNNYFKLAPISRTVTTTAAIAQNFDTLHFAIQSTGVYPDLAVSLGSADARPGFRSISVLTFKNVGTTVLNGTISLTLDAKQTFVSADSNDLQPIQNGNVLTWSYTNLFPFEVKNIRFTLKTLLTAPLNSIAVSIVNSTIIGATDANPLNNTDTTRVVVRGSYDPNDKQVDKTAIKTITSIATTPLTYTIRFQNTGNADAIRVEVVDSLTKKLDITSIEMLGASHPYELKIVSDSGKVKDFTVVKWIFDDIYLPDSTTNEKGSHGFVKFRIKNDTKKMGLTVDSIFNKAAIYFDFNTPIFTNRVRTLFSPTVATTELKDLGLSVFPNPTSGVLTINSTHTTVQNLTIDVINTSGQVLMHQILRGPNPQVNIQTFTSGLYFLKVTTAEGIGIVKIFKQ
jgi:hypothetical protein